MALGTYDEILAAVQSFLGDRSDLLPQVPIFITLMEDRANRKLRTRAQETVVSLSPTGGIYTLPGDYIEYRSVTAKTNPRRTLDLIDQAYADAHYGHGGAGIPAYFTLSGTSLTVYPASTDDIELAYYAKIPALDSDNPTNWLLSKSPRVYLDGACAEAARYIHNWEAEGRYTARFEQALEDICVEDAGSRWSRGQMRPRMQTP